MAEGKAKEKLIGVSKGNLIKDLRERDMSSDNSEPNQLEKRLGKYLGQLEITSII